MDTKNRDIRFEWTCWCELADETLQEELAAMAGDAAALEDAFFQDLKFGTGGLRGIVGAGPNRLNIHTVARATQGLATVLKSRCEEPSIAVCRDSRAMGWEFMQVVAGVLAANGVTAWLFPRIEPTPALSFATRYLHCSAGVNLTASHNPKEYNGYKVYAKNGCQITTQDAHDIQAAIESVDMFNDVLSMPWQEALASGYVHFIGEDCIDKYLDSVAAQSLDLAPDTELDVVFTPLNGTGQECVGRILDRIGNVNVTLVPEQSYPDGDFLTCVYPNPEIKEALSRGIVLCESVWPDLLLATDPDCDRVGIAVRHGDRYQLLTGNEVGILLTDYVARAESAAGHNLSDEIVYTTVVSSDMVDALAHDYGFQVCRTLTGFKFIGDQIGLLEQKGETDRFMFGFEESYGYLRGSQVRDKDAVVASMLVCQMARFYKSHGYDLVDAMNALYERYGHYRNAQISVGYPGAQGAVQMASIMSGLRDKTPMEVAGLVVEQAVDYMHGLPMPVLNPRKGDESQTLPISNVLELRLAGGSKVIVRPSGTEPKVKAYLFAKASTASEVDHLIERLDGATSELLAPKEGR